MWDPGQYLRYAGERARPFFDLVSRVGATDPGYVADLGCGPGNLTAALADRWPGARVLGVDNSPEMISAARAEARERNARYASRPRALSAPPPRSALPAPALCSSRPRAPRPPPRNQLSFTLADIRDWRPDRELDVLISNAVLQWVPGHLEVVRRWPGMLAPGGWLAFQLPGNFDQPTHAILLDLVTSARWAPLLPGVQLNRQAQSPASYLDLLASAGCSVDAWETTYLHVLPGPDPVTEWYRGTGLRPVLSALDAGQAELFLADYSERVARAYPAAPYGTVLPFRRVFVVARVP